MPTSAHAYLITGGTAEEREREVRQTTQLATLTRAPDVLILEAEEGKAMGIDRIRELGRKLSLKPIQRKQKTAVILEAQHLTTAAQNALLKTLEEPPAHSQIVLTSPTPEALLPTIVSRCASKKLKAKPELNFDDHQHQKARQEFLNLLSQSRGERLSWGEQNKDRLTDRAQAQILLSHWIAVLREQMLQNPANENATRIGEWVKTSLKHLRLIETTNTSPRLAIENILVTLPPQPLTHCSQNHKMV